MIKIILDININKKEKLTLKDKQSILYTLINMYSNYWKSLHESANNIKSGFSFYIAKNEQKMYINISEDRFKWLQLKYYLNKNLDKTLLVKDSLSITYSNFKIRKLWKEIFSKYDILETLAPIYINTKIDSWAWNLNLEYNEENIDKISSHILENINNYTWFDLKKEDITIIPTFQTRLLTWFWNKHAWSAYFVKLMFKENNENKEILNKVKEILLTNFFKSSYTGYFILK